MIYKVQTDFTSTDSTGLETVIKKLSKDFNVLFFNNCLFASVKNLQMAPDIRKLLTPKSKFYITDITEENLRFEHNTVVEWCKDNFIKLDIQRFEKENQDRLKAIMELLEETEAKLKDN